MKIVALDPGGTTGVSILQREPDSWTHQQLGPEDHHAALWHLLQTVAPDIVVCERFNYQRRELDKGVSLVLVSVEYIGITKLYCKQSGALYVPQNPMKTTNPNSFWTNSKLEKLGLYSTNAPHANDATGHLLWYLMQQEDKTYVMQLR